MHREGVTLVLHKRNREEIWVGGSAGTERAKVSARDEQQITTGKGKGTGRRGVTKQRLSER
jgi:hypothetical protein